MCLVGLKFYKENAQYDEKKCFAFEWDFVKEDIPNHISENSIDLVLLIFVLSAVSPEQMPNGISKLFRV
jgi:tRNAThr (cytosine32-N3)-methyltransferase